MEYYKQCSFKQFEGTRITTAWVPDKKLKIGKKVYFKDVHKEDDPNKIIWVIKSISDTRIDEKAAKSFEDAYRRHRDFSDI